MNVNIEQPRSLTDNEVLATRALYYRYSSWLLGYLIEVVKDYTIAEQYLIEVFKEVPYCLDDFTGSEKQPWKSLRRLAQSKLRGVRVRDLKTDGVTPEKLKFDGFVSDLTIEQQIVFCGVYYYQKPTEILAVELSKTDADIKKILKDAFIKIKNG